MQFFPFLFPTECVTGNKPTPPHPAPIHTPPHSLSLEIKKKKGRERQNYGSAKASYFRLAVEMRDGERTRICDSQCDPWISLPALCLSLCSFLLALLREAQIGAKWQSLDCYCYLLFTCHRLLQPHSRNESEALHCAATWYQLVQRHFDWCSTKRGGGAEKD